tara:strand:+ start:4269 stop:5978 length:1710 start_codon:yes stop_codon:yes gene_type:complete
MNVNSLLPHDHQSTQQEVAIGLESKWEKTGLLEGIDTEIERRGMAVLLENQAKQLVTEANATGTDSNAEQWSGVALPLVRRIFAEIAAKDFVSVQPMNLPSGLVFFLDFKYGTKQGIAKGGTAAGNDFISGAGRTSQTDSVFGVTDADRGTSAPSEGLYGAGRFGYSINDVTSSLTLVNTSVGAKTGSLSAAGTFTDGGQVIGVDFNKFTNYNSELSASLAGKKTQILSVPVGQLGGYDSKGIRAFNAIASGITTVYPEFTAFSSDGTHIHFLIETAATPAVAGPVQIIYQKQPTDSTRGDFEDPAAVGNNTDSSTKLDIPEINLELRSEAIVAKTRKLKAIWSPEFAQDLNAYHSIDAEAELTSMLSEYISQEIDLEILDMLMQNAQTVDRWSAKVGFEFDSASNSFVQSNATAQAYNQGTWFQTLGTKVQKVSNKIHQLTLRGGANFLVCSPTVATILESIPGYAADTDGDKMQFAMGVQKVGAINNRFQVYKNPYMTENAILMGYRGSQFLETGAVYAPYVPLIMTPLVYDPDNFTPRKGVMTRYAKKMVRPEFYGKIFVSALDTI